MPRNLMIIPQPCYFSQISVDAKTVVSCVGLVYHQWVATYK